MTTRICLGFAVCVGLTLPAVASAQPGATFDHCGTLVQGAECILFERDNGKRYVIGPVGDFEIGDRVRIVGRLDRECVSICQEGEGCIDDAEISACDDETRFNRCGTLVQGTECVLLESAGGRYAVENLGDFEVGDRVRVIGTRDDSCASLCQEGDGCVVDNTIRRCAGDGTCGVNIDIMIPAAAAAGLMQAGRRRFRTRSAAGGRE